jgi:hypothetical protein
LAPAGNILDADWEYYPIIKQAKIPQMKVLKDPEPGRDTDLDTQSTAMVLRQ